MVEFGILLLVVFGAFWLFFALIGGLFKMVFGVFGLMLGAIGAVFGGLLGLFGLGLAALIVVPILFFALLPVLLPVLCIVGLVWLIVRASHPHPAPAETTQAEPAPH